jgi:hypothetical protein
VKGFGKKERPKFGNRKVVIDGELFDSEGEAWRWLILQDDQAKGLISELERQVRVDLTAHGKKICFMKVDFRYRLADGTIQWEDFKGMDPQADWVIKAKLFEAQMGCKIVISRRPGNKRKKSKRRITLGGI